MHTSHNIVYYIYYRLRLAHDKDHLSIAKKTLRIVSLVQQVCIAKVWGHNYFNQMANNLLLNYTVHSIFIVDVVLLSLSLSFRSIWKCCNNSNNKNWTVQRNRSIQFQQSLWINRQSENIFPQFNVIENKRWWIDRSNRRD